MDAPRRGGSSCSGKHVDGSGEGRGSGSELLGTLDALEGDWDDSWHREGHWCPGWLVVVGGGVLELAGLDCSPGAGIVGSESEGDSGSTAAETFIADKGGLALHPAWSPGSVGESLLTSATGSTSSWWSWKSLEHCLDVVEVLLAVELLGLERGPVVVESSSLAGKNGISLGFHGGLVGFLGLLSSVGCVGEGCLLCCPVVGLLLNLGSEGDEVVVAEGVGEGLLFASGRLLGVVPVLECLLLLSVSIVSGLVGGVLGGSGSC